MLSVNAVYEDGKVTLLEDIPNIKRARLIVTVLPDAPPPAQDAAPTLFADLVGILSARDDGAIEHDRYLTQPRP